MMCAVPSLSKRIGRALLLIAVLRQFLTFAHAQIVLAWDPPLDPQVTGYRVYFGTGPRAYSRVLDAGDTTTFTVPSLAASTTYFFAITAYNSSGLESDFSSEVSGALSPNQAPTLNPIANLTIMANASLQTVALTGISSGSTNEIQTLTVSASSGNPALIPVPTVNYTSPNSTGSIAFTPVASASGSATLTVTVRDGAVTNNSISRSFTVTVNPVNKPPAISTVTNLVLAAGATSSPLPVTVSDPETPAGNLMVTGESDNQSLVKNSAIVLSGTGTSRTVTVTSMSSQTGLANITLTVNDGSSSSAASFPVNVRAKPLPPGKVRPGKG